ncbi:MAG: hypothetical protein WCK78_06715 [Paludibacter sp.]
MKNEVQRIISGESEVRYGANIQAILSYLTGSEIASSMVKADKHYKKEETKKLKQYIDNNRLWVDINPNNYVSEGAEQKVYLNQDRNVYKLNDAIYYLSWVDYFHNLLLNNYFFPDTAYKLLGFFEENNAVYAVVEQPFVKATSPTDLNAVKEFMKSNGFENTRNNDYFNPELGIILEDLHDENVLTQHSNLYFIDTVFYIKEN